MKTATLKGKLLIGLVLMAVFILPFVAQGALLVNIQTTTPTSYDFSSDIVSQSYSPSTHFGSSNLLGSITVWIGMNNSNFNSLSSSCPIYVTAYDNLGNPYTSQTVLTGGQIVSGSTVAAPYNFTFPTTGTINFASKDIEAFQVLTSCSTGGPNANSLHEWGTAPGSGGDGFNGQLFVNSTGMFPNNSLVYQLYDQAGSLLGGFNIGFPNPPFAPNFSSVDFTAWQTCITIPAYHPSVLSFDFSVTYGTSTPDTPWIDDNAADRGLANLASGTPFTGCPGLNKLTALSPGNYQAQATLFDQGGSALAQSSILYFTITTSSPSSTPPVLPGGQSFSVTASTTTSFITTPICPSTSFVVFGADIGKGTCDVLQFIATPSQAQLDAPFNDYAIMQTKAPFSYYFDVLNDITQSASSSSSTLQGLTITTGSSTPIQVTVDMFSANTINRYSDPTSRSFVRTLIQWGLYLSFATMVIFKIRNIFKSGEGGQ